MNDPHTCHGNRHNTFSVLDDPGGRQNLILAKTSHAPICREFLVHCPAIARSCAPGQFVIVRRDECSERVPLTIADYDPAAGDITIVMHVVGLASHKIDDLGAGDRFRDIVGPLGKPSEIENFGTVALVAGGLGIAPVYPIQRALKAAGNRIVSIVGARAKELLFWRERMRATSDTLVICTDDGSEGDKALVTEPLLKLIAAGEKIDRVIAIGPPVMMRAVAEATRSHGIKTIVSLNALMIDGTGMCGGCRVEVGGVTKFTCVDGPEFDGHAVDFSLLSSRLGAYRPQEHESFDSHCRAEAGAGGPLPDALPAAPGRDDAPLPVASDADAVPEKAASRVAMPAQDPARRRGNFAEVATGYTPGLARSEAARCLQCRDPRCVAGCPVQVRIPEFIALIRDGRPVEACAQIKETNNLPAICGRVCPQETQCEARCVLGKTSGGAVAIGRLERFAADMAAAGENPAPADAQAAAPDGARRVAIAGAGPAGLTAAADLARLGYRVTVFEALHAPGGVLAYGIPEFRLPKAIVARECRALEKLGVEFRVNFPIGPTVTAPGLLDAGYGAVFIGTGAGLPRFMGIPGENLKGVYSSNEFLARVNLMKAYRFPEYDTPVAIGRRVAVVGGGNVAMDSARCALRLGAESVTIAYRRTRAELPARAEEVEHAREEGVEILELAAPLEVAGDGEGWVAGLRLRHCRLGEPGPDGRPRPVEIEGDDFTLECDQVIVAIGNGPNPVLTSRFAGLRLDGRGNIPVDENGMTNVPGVFAGGDIVTGAATVIEAMGAGKRAAAAIHKYLAG